MSATSPYRIAGERLAWADPVPLRVTAPPAAESDADIDTVACEYNAPADPAPFPIAQVLSGFAIGGAIAVAITAIIVAASRLLGS